MALFLSGLTIGVVLGVFGTMMLGWYMLNDHPIGD